ncbi:uncharacterized protein BX664DRAFT_332023 [Halteromyces radiatus]|uniref:uncharacterized protein n=1 Tax=Halteromyces radiatus TaxID=101107 RepID=UPI00221F8B31|nr:uncharacterized protein BX664DRAFT_332023 [Halteromyces radiatus]KAI8089040.1 hypothetical protein BX664DRAFT_332023 [Halteromyces radiatus]
MTNNERILVIGATGNIGKKLVQELTDRKVATTIYVRNPIKAKDLFGSVSDDYLTVVQGDFDDLTPLKEALPGHTRLFLLVPAFNGLPRNKKNIASLAYEAGVEQIVDLSSLGASLPSRTIFLGREHQLAEDAILELAHHHSSDKRRTVVNLRPGRFTSNLLAYDRPTQNEFIGLVDAQVPQTWISPNDIAIVAANILTDDIDKHGDAVYELLGDAVTGAQTAEILTRVLGRPYTYKQISAWEKYQLASQSGMIPHRIIYDLITISDSSFKVTPGLTVLLNGNAPETLEAYITANAHLLQ